MGPCGPGCVCGSEWVGCTGRGEAWLVAGGVRGGPMGPCGPGCVCGSEWEGCTGRGEARGSRELCSCAGYQMLMLKLI